MEDIARERAQTEYWTEDQAEQLRLGLADTGPIPVIEDAMEPVQDKHYHGRHRRPKR